MFQSACLRILFLATALSASLAHAATWPHETSDIAVDPAVRYGVLENGMRYALMQNSEPPEQIALRLHVAAGSLQETEEQRGLAHFLEHMAFNGSKNFPDVEALITEMQRLGIGFGAHANAYTSYDETVYMLDLPNGSEEVVDLAFTVMRDFADGLLIEAEEIEKERGVIISEMESRDSVDRRLFEQQFDFLLPDFRASKRLPIGIESVILEAARERFIEFYETYYVPSQLSFVAVGDFDLDTFEAAIIDAFQSMEATEADLPELDMGTIPQGFGFRAAAFADEEVSQDELSLSTIRPYKREPDTIANRTKRLPLSFANTILNRRFRILSKEEGAPITGGGASYFNWLNSVESVDISVTPIEGKWAESVAVMEQELRRALKYGFTEAEVEEVRANLINSLEESAKRAPTRQSPPLASKIFNAIHEERVFSHPEENLRILRPRLETITPEECHAALIEAWKEPDLNLILTTKVAPDGVEAQLTELYQASTQVAVEAPEPEEALLFAYTDFGPEGEIAERTEVADLAFTQLVLSNGVRVNLKETDFKKNSILLSAQFGSGILTQPKDKVGLNIVASTVLNQGGLGQHSKDDLTRILAGKNAGYGYGIGADSFSVSGTTTADDLELQLQLMCAAITDPGYRDEALRQLHKVLPSFESELKHTLGGAMSEMNEWLNGNDGRFAKPDIEQVATYTNEDVIAWIAEDFANSYLELSIVGDFKIDAALPLILKTFGALAERSPAPEPHTEARKIQSPDFPAEQSFTYQSKIDKASAIVSWKCEAQVEDIRESRRMRILSKILGDRLRKTLREEMGFTYSPSARFSMSPVFGTAFLTSSSIALAAETAELNEKMLQLGQDLAENGATQDELDRALSPVIESLPKSLRKNSHWLNVIIGRSQAEPYRLGWARNREADYASISLAEVNTLAKKYLNADNAAIITLSAEPSEAPEEE